MEHESLRTDADCMAAWAAQHTLGADVALVYEAICYIAERWEALPNWQPSGPGAMSHITHTQTRMLFSFVHPARIIFIAGNL